MDAPPSPSITYRDVANHSDEPGTITPNIRRKYRNKDSQCQGRISSEGVHEIIEPLIYHRIQWRDDGIFINGSQHMVDPRRL